MKLYLICAAIGLTIIGLLIFNKHYSPMEESIKYEVNHSKKIIDMNVDERGLTSIVYTQGKDTLALDYLTQDEFNNFCK